MYIFQKATQIECSLDSLYKFHSNVSNLPFITPMGIEVTLLDDIFSVKEGDTLHMKVKQFFVTIPWTIKITKAHYPDILIDTALKSPFAFWEHHHIFRQKEDGCELKDVVFYELPYGFIGRLFSRVVTSQLEAMFTYRHEQTKKILESKDKH